MDSLDWSKFVSSSFTESRASMTLLPVSTSMNVEIVTNKKALTTVRNKKKELKDLDNHAWESTTKREVTTWTLWIR